MKLFSTRETARILEATEAQVRNYARLGQIMPQRGPGRRLEFSFQELLLLKTTKGLVDSGVPPRRMRHIWSSLRRQLAQDLPLTSITIFADGHRAIAWDGNAQWRPDSGQFLLNFEAGEVAERAGVEPARDSRLDSGQPKVEPPRGSRSPSGRPKVEEPRDSSLDSEQPKVEPPRGSRRDSGRATKVPEHRLWVEGVSDSRTSRAAASETPLTAEHWFNLGCELESASPQEARQAYLQALEIDPEFADVHVNLGRHYHEAGELGKAEAHYRDATRYAPEDATCHFNLGVLLEERGRPTEAIHAYQQAITRDPEAADAHYNLGLLFESMGRRSEAIRHLMIARQLYDLTPPGE